MSTRSEQFVATVLSRRPIGDHLVRLELGGGGLAGFTSTGVPDEWVGLVVPGQYQSRYYTVREWTGAVLTLDVVLHDQGLVTEWASRDCVGEDVTISAPKAGFALPHEAGWMLLVGDLTALPAMARIAATTGLDDVRLWAEVPEPLPDYLPAGARVNWLTPPSAGLADLVRGLDWPSGPGYFWMAGESAQMRAIRTYLMRERRLPSSAYSVMGYWRAAAGRRPRAVDPGPIWRAGQAAGHSEEQIWAAYDDARERADR